MNKTKIVATIGPKSASKEMLISMISEGMNLARINFSHGEYGKHADAIKAVREINAEKHTNVGILADLQGPKIRLGEVADGVIIKEGAELMMTTVKCDGDAKCVHITYTSFAKDVVKGDQILINDGKLVLEVISSDGEQKVKTRVIHGGPLESRKGVNLPNTRISLPSLTEKDRADLEFGMGRAVIRQRS